MRRVLTVMGAAGAFLIGGGGPAFACGGLIGPNGAVNLLRTSTFAGYANGTEHYLTAFKFAGGGGAFGSLTPLPGVPTKVERGGDWTLQRLVRETEPVRLAGPEAFAASADAAFARRAEVLLEVEVDALDITVLKGGGTAVGEWAKEHGFRLPPDAPEVLDFYAKRSPIFLAARFDADRAKAKGQGVGDGTPVHITIPTTNPWVPLRILALGKQASEFVAADVYLLTERKPVLLSTSRIGRGEDDGSLSIVYQRRASAELLNDLHTDKGGDWVPLDRAWLTKVRVAGAATTITGDLAIDASGQGVPSRVAAGFDLPDIAPILPSPKAPSNALAGILIGLVVAILVAAAVVGSIGSRRTAG